MATRDTKQVKYLRHHGHRRRFAIHLPGGELRRIYWSLSKAFDELDVASHTLNDAAHRAAAAVLLEDLECLEEECETYLVVDRAHLSDVFESLDARSQTVLEEVQEFLLHAEYLRSTRSPHSLSRHHRT